MTAKPSSERVEIIHPSYQPSREELRQDLRVDATFEEAAKALVKSVKVQYFKPSKQK